MCFKIFRKTFSRWRFKSAEQTHWVNHIYDETVVWPNKAAMWCNVHGFDEGPGSTYWIGLDFRSFGIRTADYIIKCKNKKTYDRYIYEANHNIEGILNSMKYNPDLRTVSGDNVNTEFIFRWGDDDKSFNLHLGWDCYSEEK